MARRKAEMLTDGYVVKHPERMPTAARELAEHIEIELRNVHCGYPDSPARVATAEEQAASGKRKRRRMRV